MSRALLDKLLQHSYDNYQVLFNHLKYHNHNAHYLGSLYILGVSDERLEELYKVMCAISDPHEPSPYEITRDNWRDFLGNRHCCKAYKDFFEKEIFASGDNWRQKLLELLLEHKEAPLINGVVGGVGHPLIHIGYALELGSNIVAVEALTQTAVNYDELHEIIDKLEPPKIGTKSALEIFQDIHEDRRLPFFEWPEDDYLVPIAKCIQDIVLSHYDKWKIDINNLEKSVEELFDLTVYIYGATHPPERIEFDFFVLHLVSAMHAVSIIIKYLDNPELKQHILMEFFFLACVVYITKRRPKINKNLIDDYFVNTTENNWQSVIQTIVNSKLAEFRHLPKLIHFFRNAESAFGYKNGFYIKIAVKTLENLNGDDAWVGSTDNPQVLMSLKYT